MEKEGKIMALSPEFSAAQERLLEQTAKTVPLDAQRAFKRFLRTGEADQDFYNFVEEFPALQEAISMMLAQVIEADTGIQNAKLTLRPRAC
jgi:hypothetical protein